MFYLIGINGAYFAARLHLGPEIWNIEDLPAFDN